MKRYNLLANYGTQNCPGYAVMKEDPNGEWVKYEDINIKQSPNDISLYQAKDHLEQLANMKCATSSFSSQEAQIILDELNKKPEPKRKVYQLGVKEVSYRTWIAMCDGKEVGRQFGAKNECEAEQKVEDMFNIFGFVTGMMEIKKEK